MGRCSSIAPGGCSSGCHGNCCEATGLCSSSSCTGNALGDEELSCPFSSKCPLRGLKASCVKYDGSCNAPNCFGAVRCDSTTPCETWEGAHCFYDGLSSNWKVCQSPACVPTGFVGQSGKSSGRGHGPRVSRLSRGYKLVRGEQGIAAADGNSAPSFAEVGGEAFAAALSMTLNLLRDRVDNAACGESQVVPVLADVVSAEEVNQRPVMHQAAHTWLQKCHVARLLFKHVGKVRITCVVDQLT